MTQKLSTERLRALLLERITTDELLRQVVDTYVDPDPRDRDESLADMAQQLGCSPGEVEARLRRVWSDPRTWKRREKRRLGDERSEWNIEDFTADCAGGLSRDATARCWLRVFYPNDEPFTDNFRIEVVTSEDDHELVGWNLIVD